MKDNITENLKYPDFRVVEYDGVFRIERKVITTETKWLKKHTKTEWCDIDYNGNVLRTIRMRYYNYTPPTYKTFRKLKSAFKAIEIIANGKQIHYI